MKNTITVTSFIKLTVLTLLILWAFYLLKPFIGIMAWAIILAVAIYPFYEKIVNRIGIKWKKPFSILFTLLTIMILIVPTYSMISSILESTTDTVKQIKNNTLKITPPSHKVKEWPLVGEQVYENWQEITINAKEYILVHKEYILEKGEVVVSSFTKIMGSLLVFIASFIIAVVFMFNAENGYKGVTKLATKLIGNEGEELVKISRNTIRSVVKGILLVAIIQSFLSFIGFSFIGLPAAGVFAFIVLFSAIVQIPVTIAVIPAIVLAFSISDNTTITVIFTIYILIVSLLDNFLKPILLAKGLQTPTIIIFLGAIGGVMLHGIIGLFIGTVVLAIVHQFYIRWVNAPEEKGI